MITNKNFSTYPMALPEVKEVPHRDIKAYKIKGKIFVTHNAKESRCCVRLSAIEQPLFCSIDKNVIYEVPNKWSKYGWTLVNLKLIKREMLQEILIAAYCCVAPSHLSAPFIKELDSF